MSQTAEIVLALAVLVGVYALTRKVHAWRIRRTYLGILRDLEEHRAVDAASAVGLPYAKASLFKLGLRDDRPKVLQHLVAAQVVGLTPDGKYYLRRQSAAADLSPSPGQ